MKLHPPVAFLAAVALCERLRFQGADAGLSWTRDSQSALLVPGEPRAKCGESTTCFIGPTAKANCAEMRQNMPKSCAFTYHLFETYSTKVPYNGLSLTMTHPARHGKPEGLDAVFSHTKVRFFRPGEGGKKEKTFVSDEEADSCRRHRFHQGALDRVPAGAKEIVLKGRWGALLKNAYTLKTDKYLPKAPELRVGIVANYCDQIPDLYKILLETVFTGKGAGVGAGTDRGTGTSTGVNETSENAKKDFEENKSTTSPIPTESTTPFKAVVSIPLAEGSDPDDSPADTGEDTVGDGTDVDEETEDNRVERKESDSENRGVERNTAITLEQNKSTTSSASTENTPTTTSTLTSTIAPAVEQEQLLKSSDTLASSAVNEMSVEGEEAASEADVQWQTLYESAMIIPANDFCEELIPHECFWNRTQKSNSVPFLDTCTETADSLPQACVFVIVYFEHYRTPKYVNGTKVTVPYSGPRTKTAEGLNFSSTNVRFYRVDYNDSSEGMVKTYVSDEDVRNCRTWYRGPLDRLEEDYKFPIHGSALVLQSQTFPPPLNVSIGEISNDCEGTVPAVDHVVLETTLNGTGRKGVAAIPDAQDSDPDDSRADTWEEADGNDYAQDMEVDDRVQGEEGYSENRRVEGNSAIKLEENELTTPPTVAAVTPRNEPPDAEQKVILNAAKSEPARFKSTTTKTSTLTSTLTSTVTPASEQLLKPSDAQSATAFPKTPRPQTAPEPVTNVATSDGAGVERLSSADLLPVLIIAFWTLIRPPG